MTVTVINPGKLVKVEPDKLDGNDILDFAAALIEEQGHKKHDSGDAAAGWSMHGAIGEAARRASDSHAKDSSSARPLREMAEKQLEAAWPDLGNQFEMNDLDTTDQAKAVELLRGAIRPYTIQPDNDEPQEATS